jgi:hypothetical protein
MSLGARPKQRCLGQAYELVTHADSITEAGVGLARADPPDPVGQIPDGTRQEPLAALQLIDIRASRRRALKSSLETNSLTPLEAPVRAICVARESVRP